MNEPIENDAAHDRQRPVSPSPAPSTWIAAYIERLVGPRPPIAERAPHLALDSATLWIDSCWTLVTAMLMLVPLALLHSYASVKQQGASFALIMPPFGASAAMLAGMPHSPFAHPQNVILSHLIGGVLGLSLGWAFKNVEGGIPVAGAIAAALVITVNHVINRHHPPSGATAYFAASVPSTAVMGGGFFFLVFPVLVGSVYLVVLAWIANNLSPLPNRRYPATALW